MRASAVALAATAVLASCGDRKREPMAAAKTAPARGLAAVPSSARVVIGVDVEKLARSPLVRRAVAQMFLRDPAAKARLDAVFAKCEFDPAADLETLIIGMGDGDDEVFLTAVGRFSEARWVACLRRHLEGAGGGVAARKVAGRVYYHAAQRPNSVWFGFGDSRVALVSRSELWLRQAIRGESDNVTKNRSLMGLVERADRSAALWAAGQVPAPVSQGLLRLGEGKLRAGARGFFLHVDLAAGLKAELGAVFDHPQDAKALESLLSSFLIPSALVAQVKGLGPAVKRISASSEGPVTRMQLSLTTAEVKRVVSALDLTALDEQKENVDTGDRQVNPGAPATP